MNRFAYREAQTVPEAIDILRQEDGGRIVAGATDTLIRWRLGAWKPQYVLNIKRIPDLDTLRYSPDTGLSLGPLVTIRTLERQALVQTHYPALAQAAMAFAGVQIRNLATVGGNICNASPAGDTLPALLAYNAECRIAGPAGERVVPLADFIVAPGRTALQPAEMLVEVHLPALAARSGGLYIKHSPRSTMDIATVGVAAVVTLAVSGNVCQEVRITLGAVAPTVVRASAAEAVLRGQLADAATIQRAAQVALEAAHPIDDIRATAAHRRRVVVPLVQRAVHYAVQMAQGIPLSSQMQRSLAVEATF